MQKITVLFSLLGTIAFAAQDTVVNPTVKGVIHVDESLNLKGADLDQIDGIQSDGASVAGGVPFLSDLPMTADGVQKLCEAIASHYRESEDLRVAVSVPNPDPSAGVVQVVVAPERLGEVTVKDNRYTKARALKKWVRLSTSDAINEKTLAQDVGWMNTNPFRNVKVDYQPGEAPGRTNVDLVVSDKKNWKVSSGVDNTGTNPIGPIRIFAGVNVNNFLFTDHTLNFQTTTADHYSEYQSYTAQYVAPLPWRNTARVFGTFTRTAPERADFPQKHRQTYQTSGRYAIPQWFGSNPWIDQITFELGADFKGTNTNILFEDDALPVEKRLAFLGQFLGSVNAQRTRGGNKITGGIDFVGSPSRMLPHQTEVDFNNLRKGATPRYLYSRLALAVEQKLTDDWTLFVQGRTQLSLSNLVPSEQFSLGGYSTVRGYEERVVNGDNAVCGNLEIRTPKFPAVALWLPKFGDSLSLLGFVDAGYAWFRNEVPDAPLHQSLLGFGPGLRYSISSYFTSRLDVGFPLLEVENDSGKPHIHFNAILAY